MFNNRIVVANKDLFISIFRSVGKDYNNYKETINNYSSVFKPLAAWMLSRDADEFAINDIVSHLTEYINRKKLNPANIKVSKNSVLINDEQFDDLMILIDFVHATFPIVKKQEEQSAEKIIERTPMLTGDGIQIFKVDRAQDSKELAADTSWCIAYKGPNNMWQSYRSNQAATFFIVWDENPPTPNQRKVALQYNKNNVQITDISNRTGTNLTNDITFEYQGQTITGRDIPTYLIYLKSKGVDIDATFVNPETGQEEKLLKNKPITPEEQMETEIGAYVKNQFSEIGVEDIKSWATGEFTLTTPQGFINKVRDGEYQVFTKDNYSGRSFKIPYDFVTEEIPFDDNTRNALPLQLRSVTFESENIKTYLAKFIGMGWIMPDEIVDYLLEVPGGKDYLIQYVNTGLQLPKSQVDKLSTNKQLLNSYLKQQLLAFELGHNNSEFLQYIDTDNEEVKKIILERHKKNSFINIPLKWLKVLPQIGVFKFTGPGFDFGDEFINQLAIAHGNTNIYEQFPTLENTKILLHFPEAIDQLKPRAEAEGYSAQIFRDIDELSDWTVRWKSVPEIFHDNPEFQVYKAAAEAGQNSYDRLDLKRHKGDNPDDFLYYTILLMNNEIQLEEKNSPIVKNPEFWKFAINNFDHLIDTVFNKIKIMHRDLPNEFDEEEDDEEDYDEIEDKDKQRIELAVFLKNMPQEIFFSPEIIQLIKSKFDLQMINNAVVEILQIGWNIDALSAYIKDFDDLAQFSNYGFTFFTEPNNLMKTLVRDHFDEQKFLYALSNLTGFRFDIFEILTKWLPELLLKISDEAILRIISTNRGTLYREFLDRVIQYKPDFIKKYPDRLFKKMHPQDIYYYLTEELRKQEEEADKTIDSEEDKFASIKTMVKIAKILDLKKEYRLADKLTYMI
jgi:hypothetical protein